MQQLFSVNFPGMEVEVLDWRSPKLAYYHCLCPSRAKPAAAAAAVPAAAAASTGISSSLTAGLLSPRSSNQQFVVAR
jgi:hypothetical protein